ncbi:hypothetical protein [Mucilaginibacter antarcticus]|uniref:hypothetical protein n=1 Tax=Mucilaginibacter antarcticus TaxID=1855725 RepID=UPI00362F81A1
MFLILIAVVLSVLFGSLYFKEQSNFTDVAKRLQDGTMVNLNAKNAATNIGTLLRRGYYFEDKRDIDLIVDIISERLKAGSRFENIGELNKRRYDVNADTAMRFGGKSFQQRVVVSRSLLGYTGADSLRFIEERTKPPVLQTVADAGMTGNSISGLVLEKSACCRGFGTSAVNITSR